MAAPARFIIWFSCGAASAVATKLIIDKYGKDPKRVRVVYCDTRSEHPDNRRFLYDVERWLNIEIDIIRNDEYEDIWDVFRKRRYIKGRYNAICSDLLKRRLMREYVNPGDINVVGYCFDEGERLNNFLRTNPEANITCPLIDAKIRHSETLAIIKGANIELPYLYRLGYANNNCLGCVKGGTGYWNRIRRDFPEIYARMAKIERELDYAMNRITVNGKRRSVFLDSLPYSIHTKREDEPMSCGILCESIIDSWKDDKLR